MKNFIRHVYIGALYCLQALKMRLEYRFDFFVECLAALAQQAVGLLTLHVVFTNFHSMGQWTQPEVIFIYGFAMIPMAFFDAFALNLYQFSDKYLVGGELDRLMLRPLSSLFQLLLEGLSFDFLADLVLAVVVMSYAWEKVGLPVTVLNLLEFLMFAISGWAVLFGMFLALTSISFWSQDRLSFLPPVYNLLTFARYPLNIYGTFVKALLTFAIPFGFVAFYPSAAFLKTGEPFRNFAYAAPFAGAGVLAIGLLTWRAGTRRYTGAGS